jgi:hypothetical protein
MPSIFTKFDYRLNAVEDAGRHPNPAALGYGEKRQALYAHVRAMEAVVKAADEAVNKRGRPSSVYFYELRVALAALEAAP